MTLAKRSVWKWALVGAKEVSRGPEHDRSQIARENASSFPNGAAKLARRPDRGFLPFATHASEGRYLSLAFDRPVTMSTPPATRVAEIFTHPDRWTGREARVEGWVRTRRDSKAGLSFVALSDGSCFDPIQLVCPSGLANYASEILRLTAGCSIRATGKLVASQGKGQSLEMQVETLEVLGFVDDPDTYPIQPKQHSFEYLREVAHLRPRTNTFGAIGRVRHCLAMAVHRFFHERGFFWIHTPIITGSDCEGAGQMFRVSTLDLANLPRTPEGRPDFSQDFFGKETHLTVSGQLNVETWCMALSKVYTFGPTFRAENSNTSRHLAEFWMIEPEIAFADLAEDASLAEGLLKHMYRTLLDERLDDMKFFAERIDKGCIERLEKFVSADFARMDYGDAIAALEDATRKGVKFDFPVRWGIDLQSEHERWLTETYIGRPVAVMNYPKDIKAFYMRQNDDGKTVAAMDILAPGIGEIVGGSQREERLDRLDARLAEMALNKDDYWWYRDLRRYGTVPHAGFGLGFERAIVYATGMQNIRDVIPFPRTPKNAEF
jgi:asparaginyl-tRNA synthetase